MLRRIIFFMWSKRPAVERKEMSAVGNGVVSEVWKMLGKL